MHKSTAACGQACRSASYKVTTTTNKEADTCVVVVSDTKPGKCEDVNRNTSCRITTTLTVNEGTYSYSDASCSGEVEMLNGPFPTTVPVCTTETPL